MMHWYLQAMRRMTEFGGRSSREEFWRFLFIATVQLVLWRWLDLGIGTYPVLFLLIGLIHLVPLLSVTVRRLHDADHGGWWLLPGITGVGFVIPLVLAVNPSTAGPNRFGPMPPVAMRNPAAGVPRALRGAPTPDAAEPSSVPITKGSDRDVVAEIERLARLRTDGSLTEAEYAALKARLVAQATDRTAPLELHEQIAATRTGETR